MLQQLLGSIFGGPAQQAPNPQPANQAKNEAVAAMKANDQGPTTPNQVRDKAVAAMSAADQGPQAKAPEAQKDDSLIQKALGLVKQTLSVLGVNFADVAKQEGYLSKKEAETLVADSLKKAQEAAAAHQAANPAAPTTPAPAQEAPAPAQETPAREPVTLAKPVQETATPTAPVTAQAA
jgi:hypothetical protein